LESLLSKRLALGSPFLGRSRRRSGKSRPRRRQRVSPEPRLATTSSPLLPSRFILGLGFPPLSNVGHHCFESSHRATIPYQSWRRRRPHRAPEPRCQATTPLLLSHSPFFFPDGIDDANTLTAAERPPVYLTIINLADSPSEVTASEQGMPLPPSQLSSST
ncbi:hypothetical protein V8G54_030804, partial [Vigna mungo]